MKNKTKLFKSAGLLLTLAGLCSVVSGCSVPPEIKHKNINEFFEKIDAYSSGEIILEEEDKGGGVSTYSWKSITYSNDQVFEILYENISNTTNISCNSGLTGATTSHQLDCDYGLVGIYLSNSSGKTYLLATDMTNGEPNEF